MSQDTSEHENRLDAVRQRVRELMDEERDLFDALHR